MPSPWLPQGHRENSGPRPTPPCDEAHFETGRESCWNDGLGPQTSPHPASVSACRRLNSRLQQAATVEDLFRALGEGWRALDVANLAAALQRLARLAEAWPGGAAALTPQQLLGSPTWYWLLDQVLAAARAPEFAGQSAADVLCALCKLDGLSPPILEALHGPLERALCSTQLTSRCLTDILWAFGKEGSLQPLLAAMKQPLLEAVSTHALSLDARGVVTAWWMLGETGSVDSAGQAVPLLLPRLAAATPASAGSMQLQGILQVMTACARMRFRDEDLLHALTAAVGRRLSGEEDRPTPQAVGLIARALGCLEFMPRCLWSLERGEYVSFLDALGEALLQQLDIATCQDACGYLEGLRMLGHRVPGSTLDTLLLCFAGGECGSGRGAGLALQDCSAQQLVAVVAAVCSLLRGGLCEPLLSPNDNALAAFFDALDTVLAARLSVARQAGQGPSREHDRRALTGQHLGAICGELARLGAYPCAALTEAAVEEVDSLICRASAVIGGVALANILQFLCVHGIKLSRHAAHAVCDRLVPLLLPAAQTPGQPLGQPHPARSQALPLRALCKISFAVAGLPLDHPSLLRALVAALSGALALLRSAWQRGGAAPSVLFNDFVLLAGALAELHGCGLLRTAGSKSSDTLLHLWQDAMAWIGGCAPGPWPGEGVRMQQAAVHLELSAAMLNGGDDGGSAGGPAFQIPSQPRPEQATAH